MSVRFQWDSQKEVRNIQNHDVTFAEAATVFRDLLAYIFDDEEHSEQEYRELIVGYSSQNHLLIVSFTERENRIRIISARKADRGEHEDYENAKR